MLDREGIPILFLVVAGLLGPASLAPEKTRKAPATHHVAIQGFRYVPERLEVRPGDTVVWTNHDAVPHTATKDRVFDSGKLARSERWSWTAKGAGSFTYLCTYHPAMKGQLVVR